MENIIKEKKLKLIGCKRKIILIKAKDWYDNYFILNPPIYPQDIVIATYIEWDNHNNKYNKPYCDGRETIAIFRQYKDAKSFFKTYKWKEQ